MIVFIESLLACLKYSQILGKALALVLNLTRGEPSAPALVMCRDGLEKFLGSPMLLLLSR